jgi:hypothetical protein
MKKIAILLIFFSMQAVAQQSFFRGIGVFGSLTVSRHDYVNADQDKRDFDPLNFANTFSYYYPQNHISNAYYSWGAGLFAEFFRRENLRWQTELEYINKGAREKELINAFTGERASSFAANKYTYFQWNNFLKFYYPIFYESHWYIMPGIRLEYLYRFSTPVFTSVSSQFPKFWFSGNIGLGYEFPIIKYFSGITEFHWNPDIIRHQHNNVKIRNNTLELRVGVIFRPRQKKIDDCNAPRYKGAAY